MELEKLLNKLIDRGWKPFGHNAIKISYDGMKTRYGYGAITYLYRDSYIDDYGDEVEYEEWRRQFNLRELVSKESGLRQFCCENKLVKEDCSSIELNIMSEGYGLLTDSSYQFWLISCSWRDESELEKFLLDNIKIS